MPEINLTPEYPYIPSREKLAATGPNFDVGQSVGGVQIGGQELRQVGGRSDLGNVIVGTQTITIEATESLQNAINELNAVGGGTLRLKAGTYSVSANLVLYSSIQIEGENTSTTIIAFSGAVGITMTGTNIYTTGTVAITQGTTAVVGTGTTWTVEMTGRQIFISNRWYIISAFTDTTHITLASAFADATVSGASYRIASVVKDIEIKELTLYGGTGTGITGTDVRDLLLEDVDIVACNKGFVFTNFYQIQILRVSAAACVSNGYELANGTFFNPQQLAAVSNGGHGALLSTVRSSPWLFCACDANAGDGFNITDADNCSFSVECSGNGGQGIELVSGSDNNKFFDCLLSGNASDGLKLTATSDNNVVTLSTITGNGGYGINIAASSCDNSLVVSDVFASNASGAVNDSGVGTVVRGNVGINDNASFAVKSYTAGENLAANDAVYLEDANTNVYSLLFASASSQSAAVSDTAPLSLTGNFTIECWLKLTSAPAGNDEMGLVSKWSAGAQQSYQFFYQLSGGGAGTLSLRLSSTGANSEQITSATTTLSTGTWYHLAVSWVASTSTATFYVNGASIGTAAGAFTSIFNSTAPFALANNDGAKFLNGRLDEVRVWNTNRTPTEIANNYNQDLFGAETGLQGYWKLENDYADSTVNAATLSPNNVPTFSTDIGMTGRIAGKVYKTSGASVSYSATFLGFATAVTTSGNPASVAITGDVPNFTSLTQGSQYYLSNTAGAIATAAGTVTRKVGIATSATTLLITNIW